ncbi:YETS2 protein, partial [Polypterus senegalus]
MSGVKRQIEDKDPDYEEISVLHQSKRLKVDEQNARDAIVQKIEAIIKNQFSLEMKNKQHEIEIIAQDTFGVSPLHDSDQQCAYHTGNEDSLRLYVKKTIVVGNVSKYIPPDKREENDQSTHKWMVYVRGSRKEPSIDHFVKKVWFFLHPSYKPNDLVEVRKNKSKCSIHLSEIRLAVLIDVDIDKFGVTMLDRTYTGLQTLGAETVVDIELHRHSLGPEYLCNTSQQPSTSYPLHFTSGSNSSNRTSSPVKLTHESLVAAEKGYPIKSETGRSATYLIHTTERTPSRPRMTEKIALGSHGNSAFQPITASCKIVPQSQTPSLMDSPAKSFQPITMSCKIVSGSPTSKPTGISLSSHGARSPVSKMHGSSAGSTGVKVIIKQEPGEVPQQQQHPQQILASTAASQASPQQFVAVKGGHMIALSPQKQTSTAGGGVTQGKVVGIPVGSSLQSAVKQAVAISGGQILVAKSNVAAAKVIGQKQVIAQGVAKAIVSGASGTIVAQPVQTVTKAQVTSSVTGKPASQGSVMATLQLPANNLSNLASLPPGTKLYLTTNSKNPSGKGKLLLIPQGAILRAANPSGQQAQSANSQSGSSQSTSGGTTQNLSYTSYILKQTPQGTFLVGQQSSQGPAKQISAGTTGPTASSSTGQPQTVRVTAGQKAAILAQVVSSGQTSAVKLSDNSGKTMTVATQLLKPANTLRVAGGLIAASSSVGSAVSTTSTTVSNAQISEGSSTNALTAPSQTGKATVQQAVVVSQNQTSVNKNVSMLKIHSTLSSAQQAVLTIPANQLKQLGVSTAVGGVQTILMPVNKVVQSQLSNKSNLSIAGNDQSTAAVSVPTGLAQGVPASSVGQADESNPFCAMSLEQYYSWNIGKRRATEWQRAIAVKKVLHEILQKSQKFASITPFKTKQIVTWCRHRGYTPPDTELQGNEENSIEDILTQIDNEPEFPSTYDTADDLCQRLENLQKLLKTEQEPEDEFVDVTGVKELSNTEIKQENEEENEEVKFYMGLSPSMEYVRESAEQIGITFQPVELEKNVYGPAVENMILKATEQFASEILREALAVAYEKSPQNKNPKEVTAMNLHQAINSIARCDFLTNKYMGILLKHDHVG